MRWPAGIAVEATAGQAHYLGTVMRRAVGETVRLFNGHDGEWAARIETLNRGKATFRVEALVRAQAGDTDVWLVFALLKRDTTDLLVQKATELGVATLLPVITERTNAARVNETIHVEPSNSPEHGRGGRKETVLPPLGAALGDLATGIVSA